MGGWKAKRRGGGIFCFVFSGLLKVRTDPRQLQRRAGRIIMTFSSRDKGFFPNDSLFGILKGAKWGGGVGIVVAGTSYAELWMMDDFSRVRSGKCRVTTVLSEFPPVSRTKEVSRSDQKRNSPVQGAPASCHPGDGPDISGLLSSANLKKRKRYYWHLWTWLVLHCSVQHFKAVKQRTRALENVRYAEKPTRLAGQHNRLTENCSAPFLINIVCIPAWARNPLSITWLLPWKCVILPAGNVRSSVWACYW